MRRGGGSGPAYNHNHTNNNNNAPSFHHYHGGRGTGASGPARRPGQSVSSSSFNARGPQHFQGQPNYPQGSGTAPPAAPAAPAPAPQPVNNHIGPGGSAVSGGDPPVETVVARLETACRLLHGIGGNNTRVNEIASEIQILSEDLRRVGPHLESAYPDVLDRVMSSMRDASAQPSLPPSLRLAIFELVELRAAKWLLPSDTSNYYRQRRNLNDPAEVLVEEASVAAANHFPVRNANKVEPLFVSQTSPLNSPQPPAASALDHAASSKTFREEILIKNSDSGKVMGVRGRRVHIIEALSDTIISFEKVAPSAKERALSINGYSQQSLSMAKQLIQETITRNASPVLVGDSNADGDCSGDPDSFLSQKLRKGLGVSIVSDAGDSSLYHYTVTLGSDALKVSGRNLQFVQEAKLALDDYFCQKYPDLFYDDDEEEEHEQEVLMNLVRLVHRYDRDTLLNLSTNNYPPPDFSHLDADLRQSIILSERRNVDYKKPPQPKCDTRSAEIVPG